MLSILHMCACIHTQAHTVFRCSGCGWCARQKTTTREVGKGGSSSYWPLNFLKISSKAGLLQFLLSANRTIMIRATEPCDRMPSPLSDRKIHLPQSHPISNLHSAFLKKPTQIIARNELPCYWATKQVWILSAPQTQRISEPPPSHRPPRQQGCELLKSCDDLSSIYVSPYDLTAPLALSSYLSIS